MCKNKIKELKRYNRFKKFYKSYCTDWFLWKISCKNKTDKTMIIKSVLMTFYNSDKTIIIDKNKKNMEILLNIISNANFIIYCANEKYYDLHITTFNFNKNPCKNLNNFTSYYDMNEICETINIKFDKIFKKTHLGTLKITNIDEKYSNYDDYSYDFDKDFYTFYKIELIDKSKKNRNMLKNLIKISEIKNV